MVVFEMPRGSSLVGQIAGYRSAEKQAFGRAAHCRANGDLEGERAWLDLAQKWRVKIDELIGEFTPGSLGANLAKETGDGPGIDSRSPVPSDADTLPDGTSDID